MSDASLVASGANTRSYFLDPLVNQVLQSLMALVLPREAQSHRTETILAAFAYCAAATHARVLPNTDGAVYGCPVCLFATKDWAELEQHRLRTNHAKSLCMVCGGHDGRHNERFCTSCFHGYSWAKEDFVVPRAEFLPPSIPQFPCPFCDRVSTSAANLVQHAARAHQALLQGKTRPRSATLLPRRHFAWVDRGVMPRQPHEPKRRARLLYQCPECHYIFTSWSQWENHVRITKHSQPYCIECCKILGRFAGEGSHTAQTGHTRICGEQPTKETHLRVVDTTIARLVDVVDSPEALSYNPGDPAQHVYQCPLPECAQAFQKAEDFAAHVEETQHGVLECELCHEVVSVVDRSIPAHPHAIPNLPCEMWFLRDPSESCLVELHESALLAYYSHRFARCKDCTLVMDKSRLDAHAGSDGCLATRGLRASAWEHHDRYLAQRAARETRDMMNNLAAIGPSTMPALTPAAPVPLGGAIPLMPGKLPVRSFGQAALFNPPGGHGAPGFLNHQPQQFSPVPTALPALVDGAPFMVVSSPPSFAP